MAAKAPRPTILRMAPLVIWRVAENTCTVMSNLFSEDMKRMGVSRYVVISEWRKGITAVIR
jgi:hypothetical protein